MTNVDPIIAEALLPVTPRKNTLKELLNVLNVLETTIDESQDITEEMVRAHFDAVKAVDQKTDALIAVMERLKMEAAEADAKAEIYKARSKSLENSLTNIKGYAKWLLETNEGLEFRGTRGKLSLQRTAPKLNISMPQFRFSSERVIPEDCVEMVPLNLRKCKQVWMYDADAIRFDLDAGKPCSIAKLEENKFVRVKII